MLFCVSFYILRKLVLNVEWIINGSLRKYVKWVWIYELKLHWTVWVVQRALHLWTLKAATMRWFYTIFYVLPFEFPRRLFLCRNVLDYDYARTVTLTWKNMTIALNNNLLIMVSINWHFKLFGCMPVSLKVLYLHHKVCDITLCFPMKPVYLQIFHLAVDQLLILHI